VQPPCPGRQVYSCVESGYPDLDKPPSAQKTYKKVDEGRYEKSPQKKYHRETSRSELLNIPCEEEERNQSP
jgi:hypothetical protein